MKPLSAKNKIIIIALAWLVLTALNFGYFFNIMDGKNRAILNALEQQKLARAILRSERESEKQAEKDLQELKAKPYQPENFFSRDITLVNEIETLDNLSKKLNVSMQLSGIAGTVNTEPKAKTLTDLAAIRYSMTLNGSLPQAMNFIETMENLSFITNIETVSINAADKDSVIANLAPNFYLRK